MNQNHINPLVQTYRILIDLPNEDESSEDSGNTLAVMWRPQSHSRKLKRKRVYQNEQ